MIVDTLFERIKEHQTDTAFINSFPGYYLSHSLIQRKHDRDNLTIKGERGHVYDIVLVSSYLSEEEFMQYIMIGGYSDDIVHLIRVIEKGWLP